jgi:hypothetical protein
MKNLSYFAIPVFAVILLLAGAFVWKMMTPVSPVSTTSAGPLPNAVNNASGNKPTNPFSFLFGPETAAPIPTPTPASVAAMNADVNAIGDDGGASDFSSLQAVASGL